MAQKVGTSFTHYNMYSPLTLPRVLAMWVWTHSSEGDFTVSVLMQL